MLTFRRATPLQWDEFLDLTKAEAGGDLDGTLPALPVDWMRHGDLIRTVGEAFGIYDDGTLAGFYWIEKRGDVLHLRGLILKEAFRGRGIGGRVIEMLAEQSVGTMIYVEVGVHVSNKRAKALFERHGFEVAQVREDIGFYIMRKPLPFRLLP